MRRRDFLISISSAAILLNTPSVRRASATQIPRRENIETFARDPDKVEALQIAFKALYARNLSEKVGWFNYAAIHGIPADDPDADGLENSLKAYWSQCHRDRSLFFIWHRAYLAAFERNLQALAGEPSLRLPYWDWYTQPSLPALFREPFIDATKKEENPLYTKNRDPNVQAGDPVWFPASSGALDEQNFGQFQGGLEGSEHGDIHLGVAGGSVADMGRVPTAARDPIFWLHHCNIDRLLTAWIDHGGKAPDQKATFDPWKFMFPIENDADYRPTASGMDMNSKNPFQTAYDSLEVPFAQVAEKRRERPSLSRRIPAFARPLGTNTLALNSRTEVTVPATGISVEFALPGRSDTRLQSVFKSTPLAEATSVVVVLDDIKLESPPAGLTGFDVFANLPAGSVADPRPYRIGAISLFNLTVEHGDHHAQGNENSYRFAATRQAKGPTGLSQDVVVTLMPRYTPQANTALDVRSVRISDFRIEVSTAPLQ